MQKMKEREKEEEKESQLLRGLFKDKMTETYTALIRKGLHELKHKCIQSIF